MAAGMIVRAIVTNNAASWTEAARVLTTAVTTTTVASTGSTAVTGDQVTFTTKPEARPLLEKKAKKAKQLPSVHPSQQVRLLLRSSFLYPNQRRRCAFVWGEPARYLDGEAGARDVLRSVGRRFLLEPGLFLAEDVVAREDDALFLHDHGGLIGGVAGHMHHAEGMVPYVQRHCTPKRDNRHIGPIAFQQCGFVRPVRGHSRHVLGHVCAKDPIPYSLMCDHRSIEEGVPRPVVPVRLGVNKVTQLTTTCDLCLQPHSVAGFDRGVDQDEAVGRKDKAVVGPT